MKASEFDSAFDDGESVTEHLDLASARAGPTWSKSAVQRRDFPVWMIDIA